MRGVGEASHESSKTMMALVSFYRVLSAILLFSCALAVHAHEPFDLSSRMVVSPETIELTATAGVDATRQILSSSGLTADEIVKSLRALSPNAVIEQPPGVADRLFKLQHEGRSLIPQKVVTRSEGLEVFFTTIYDRPAVGGLVIHAVCYDVVSDLKAGALVVVNESGASLGATLLSKTKAQLKVDLPHRDRGIDAAKEGLNTTTEPDESAETVTQTSTKAADRAAPQPSFSEFFWLGVEHILVGIDHLLFLAALLIGVRRVRTMVTIITCFTLGHSVTLAIASLNLASISPRIIEPLIALSIMVVCVMNLVRREAEGDRPWLAGGFGLIHGFGFASVLQATGLGASDAQFLMPLFSFNLGVEAGQFAVAAVFLPVLFLMRKWTGWPKFGFPIVTSVLILASGYWCFERIFMA